MSSPSKELFEKYKNRIKKRFGQNFIFDSAINNKIVSCAGILKDKNILEIGPGPGGLTFEILKQKPKNLFIIEIDDHWADIWSTQNFADFHVIKANALKFNFLSLNVDVIISNLPYNISTQLLIKLLPIFYRYEVLVLMFQKEVADRLIAKPNTKDYSKLSVFSQSVSAVKKMFELNPGSFFPSPKVKSTVVKFLPKKNIDFDFRFLVDIVNESFKHRRKILPKALKKIYRNSDIVLEKLGYNSYSRSDQISVNDYILLCNHLKNGLT